MPVTVEDSVFSILPASTYNIKLTRNAPKISFESANGYLHQRERYSHARRSYDVEFIVDQSQMNTLDNWLDVVKSDTFWWLPHEAMWKSPTAPTIRLMRITTDAVNYSIIKTGTIANGALTREPLYVANLTMLEV